jgi:cytochrome c-type biogenesis protein CcmF
MVPSLGNLALWLSLLFAFFQFIASRKNKNLKFISVSVIGLLISSLISFFILMYLHIVSDFSVLNVFQNSHTTKPLLYKISGVWGNHEGSMLLWILVLTLFNYFIFKLLNKKNSDFILKTLETQAFITIGFILFTVLTSNPFERMIPAQANGLGFNPILQDPALAIHPPLLYIGYVGFSAAFSMSIATLTLSNSEKILWYNYMKPFVVAAWTFLSIGIALGALWAYYELGWGGWWFWDPVENASLMPWLVATALVHSLIVTEKRGIYKNWSILLSILAFAASILGTFLVRSGILTSVHVFALDPERGVFILAIFSYFILGSLIFYSFLNNKLPGRSTYNLTSKEFGFLLNNILLVILALSIMFGTLFPLIYEALNDGDQISVGAPYYEILILPFALALSILQGVGLYLSWSSTKQFNFLNRVAIESFSIFVILSLLVFFIFGTLS